MICIIYVFVITRFLSQIGFLLTLLLQGLVVVGILVKLG